MPPRVLPPDFRYVGLEGTPKGRRAALAGVVAGLAATGALLALDRAGLVPAMVGGALACAAVAGLATPRPPLPRGAREVPMAIVPWGIVLSLDGERRVLRWPAIRRVRADLDHAMRGGTPVIRATVVTVETAGERFSARARGAVSIETLLANLEAYAEEASRPVAADLLGREAIGDVDEPAFPPLARRARSWLESRRGARELALPGAGYRRVAALAAGPETSRLLRRVLLDPGVHPADPRPLAALLAAELSAVELVGDLLRLINAPHPVTAALARAAALRLGAPPRRAGTLEELAAFLFDDDLEALEAWLGSAGRAPLAAHA